MDDKPGVGTLTGLSEAEVARRLREEGYNEIPSAKRRSILAIAWGVVREPMFLLLLAGGVIYLLLGDIQEALMLLGFVFVVLGITLYQERKTEQALEALRDLSSPAPWSSGTASASASRAGTWCEATSWCWSRAIVFQPTPLCSPVSTCPPTNRS